MVPVVIIDGDELPKMGRCRHTMRRSILSLLSYWPVIAEVGWIDHSNDGGVSWKLI